MKRHLDNEAVVPDDLKHLLLSGTVAQAGRFKFGPVTTTYATIPSQGKQPMQTFPSEWAAWVPSLWYCSPPVRSPAASTPFRGIMA